MIVVIGMALTACTSSNVTQSGAVTPTNQVVETAPTKEPASAPVDTPETAPSSNRAVSVGDLTNVTFLIDDQPVTLINGRAEQPAAPGSATKQVTAYFGNQVVLDLNNDGQPDVAFLLTQESGGSGNFFYVAAALKTADGYQGINAIFLGDRIAPQSTVVDPATPDQFIVNYADRKASDPMAAQPSVGVSRTFKVDNGSLVEAGVPPTQVP